jgi:hypothetical protein
MHLLCSFSTRAIKANAADLGEVAGVLADTLGEALKAISRVPPRWTRLIRHR